ncbi:serine hydrolase domain-containing protein [Planococcus sp. X10-3]|uniref:serine hydrolase domain-containing protein n=1 Tax=Planococcus sp. X10-3 TaxID=3061240 RepID=UPI003BAEA63C
MKKLFLIILLMVSSILIPEKSLAEEGTTPSGIAIEDLEDFVDQYVDEYIGETVAGASIVVIKDNEIVLSKGYGWADIENETPVDPGNTVFEWGSVSKLFVWTAVMQLVERGEIDLDADIQTYLPEEFLTKLKYDEPITMLHLMNHTAGFEDRIFDLGYSTEERVKPLEEGLRIAEPEQVYMPGEVVAYSNYSTSLAAYIIEQLTGQEFFEYVSENIFSELGIQNSTAFLPIEEKESVIQNKAEGYVLLEPSNFEKSTSFYISMYPSGSVNGTGEDLAQFALALMPEENGNSILFERDDTLGEMFSTSYSVHEDVPGIAHGFWEYDGKFRGVTHGGNTISFSSNFHVVPEENFAVVVLTNQAGESDISYGLVKELVGEAEPVIEDDLPDSQEVEGTFITARRMHSGFLNVYYYLTSMTVSSTDPDEITVSMAGMPATYTQTSPYVYKLSDDNNLFIPINALYFHVENGEVTQISTSIADFLPTDRSMPLLITYLVLFLISTAYFFISSIVLSIRFLWNKRKKRPISTPSKWHYLLNLSAAALLINVVVLAARMLIRYDRAYTEMIFQLILNYGLTILSLTFAILVGLNWKKEVLTKPQKILYFISLVNTFILIALLIIWEFYS